MQVKIKNKKISIYWSIIIALLILIVMTFFLSIFLVNYQNQILVTIFSICSVIILTTVLMFIVFVKLIPYKQYLLWEKMINTFDSQITKGKIVKIDKPRTFKNVGECQNLIISVNEKEINKFLPNSIFSSTLKIGQEYSFVIKDMYIVEVKENANEK